MASLQGMAYNGLNSVLVNDTKTELDFNKPEFDVYPNPASGSEILISLKNYKNKVGSTLTISNVIGQVLFTYIITDSDLLNGSFKVNLAENDIRKGMYFLKLSSGEQSTLKKLVVK